MTRRKSPSDATRELLRLAVSEALDALGNVADWWKHERQRVINHTMGVVRSHVRYRNGTPITDEDIVDALVAELARRGVQTNGGES